MSTRQNSESRILRYVIRDRLKSTNHNDTSVRASMAQKDSPHLVERDRGTLRLLQPRPRLLNFSRRNRPSHQLGRERDPDRHSLRSLCDSLVQSSTVPHGASPGCPDGSQTPTPSIGHRPIRGLLSRRLRTTRPTLT